MADMMMFPDTVEEFMEQYKMVDKEQIYSNGIEYVPIFRMKQWFEHVSDTDTISRQAAIDLFPNDDLEWDTKGGYIAPHLARKMVEELPSAQPEQRWIPVTERLPEETGLYLISIKTKGVEALEEIYPNGLVYVSAYDAVIMHWGYGGENVQAWQPLPEPYQEEES